MTKKQVLFCRFILILFVISAGYYTYLNTFGGKNQNIGQGMKKRKKVESNKNDEKIIKKEIELSIRPNDFYKEDMKINDK